MYEYLIAPPRVSKTVKEVAWDFLQAMRDGDYERVWSELISDESATFLAKSLPFVHYENELDKLFEPLDKLGALNHAEGFANLFMLNRKWRSAFFKGFAQGFENIPYVPMMNALVFEQDNEAVCIMDWRVPFIPFVKNPSGKYKVDMKTYIVFSTKISSNQLLRAGKRAVELKEHNTAFVIFEMAADLSKSYQTISYFLENSPVAAKHLASQRKSALAEGRDSAFQAEREIFSQHARLDASTFNNTHNFLPVLFNGYDRITDCELDESELERLHCFNDEELREAVALTLRGVDKSILEREMKKPHGPAEIADMELSVYFNGISYFRCLPFKSGKEIKGAKVPEKVMYQLTRPFRHFPQCLVVFITAKPCSQNLLNSVKLERAINGRQIEVIEHEQLAKLLKINGAL